MDYPKTGQNFIVDGNTYKWKPYHESVRHVYGKGRFQKMEWNGDFFKWKNINPPKGLEFKLVERVTK